MHLRFRRGQLGNQGGAATPSITLPFTDDFTRANGAIGGQWTGETWTISNNAAINTPVPGSDLISNGGMETGDPPTGWNAEGTVVSFAQSAEQAHGGTKSLKVVADAANEGADQVPTLAAGQWANWTYWVFPPATTFRSRSVNFGNVTLTHSGLSASAWNQIVITNRELVANPELIMRSAAAATFYLDDVSFKPLTLTELFATLPACGVAAVTAQVVVTVDPVHTQSGLVLNLDSIATPLNFMVAYLNSTTANLVKCVDGTYTSVISAAVTFNPTHNLKFVKDGDNCSLYYGAAGSEAQVGTTQAVAGMTGTIHGLFSTHQTSKFDSFQLAAT
jgi:hypothetical protein